jgi:hypothetical protein
MNWLQAVSYGIEAAQWDRPPEPPEAQIREGGRPPRAALMGGARANLTDALAVAGTTYGISVVEPTSAEDKWSLNNLDDRTMQRMRPAQLLELLVDISPDISRALWDFLRMCNPGWDFTTKPASAKKDVQAFLTTVKELYGSVDVVINRLYISGFLRGAFFGELVLGRRQNVPVDIATPDPQIARFRKVQHPDRGTIWQLGQYVNGEWRNLDSPTIRYIPIDPAPGSPYGRGLATPALFTTIFLIGLMHDLRPTIG